MEVKIYEFKVCLSVGIKSSQVTTTSNRANLLCTMMYNGVNFPVTEQDRTEEGLFTINERFGHERRPSRERTLERPPLPLARGRDGRVQGQIDGRGRGGQPGQQKVRANVKFEAHFLSRVRLSLFRLAKVENVRQARRMVKVDSLMQENVANGSKNI